MFGFSEKLCFCKSGKPFSMCHGSPSKLLTKGIVSPQNAVPDFIQKPEYAISGRPRISPPANYVETPQNIEKIRYASQCARKVLNFLKSEAKEGVTTDALDVMAFEMMMQLHVYPSPLNYCGFPKSICTSVNEVICHGIPDSRPLQKGDILNIDVTVYVYGVHGDCSEMVIIGETDEVSKSLILNTWECMRLGIETIKDGTRVSDIGAAIEPFAKSKNLSVVRAFCGHGVGSSFHTQLQVSHFLDRTIKTKLRAGMVLTVEPMINLGTYRHKIWDDQWTALTQDSFRSAQFEHTLLVTPTGYEILTLLPEEKFQCPNYLA